MRLVAFALGLALSGCNSPDRYPSTAAARPKDPAPSTISDAAAAPGHVRPPAFFERVEQRNELVREIEKTGVRDPTVVLAMRTVPRHEFTLSVFRVMAYED